MLDTPHLQERPELDKRDTNQNGATNREPSGPRSKTDLWSAPERHGLIESAPNPLDGPKSHSAFQARMAGRRFAQTMAPDRLWSALDSQGQVGRGNVHRPRASGLCACFRSMGRP